MSCPQATVAAKVRARKEQHPEQYCRAPGCLWRVIVPWAKVPASPCSRHPSNAAPLK